jgi:outer membrane lipoprotein-sorting protein
MNRRKATLGVAAVGVVAGAVGLGLVASPAGAGAQVNLPATTPNALVQSVLTAKLPAMAGTVRVDNNLGLPPLPGLPQVGNGTSQIRVWTDGASKARVSIPSTASEQTIVDDGKTVYQWDSTTKKVTEHQVGAATHAAGKAAKGPKDTAPDTGSLDPATVAKNLVTTLQATSVVTVDGTNMVAGRPAYDLVLTPKPSERTLLREVKIAIDSNTHIPLQVSVLGNNSTAPALEVGFSSLSIGAQDPSLFTFTPPAGSTVVNGDKKDKTTADLANQAAPTFVGSAWDTVVVAHIPSQLSNGSSSAATSGATSGTSGGSSDPKGLLGGQSSQSGSASSDPMSLVKRFGTPVSGSWGSGWAISTDIGTALVTSDGRLAAGFVPQQVLVQALGSTK